MCNPYFQLELPRKNICHAGHHKTMANFKSVAYVHNRCRSKYNVFFLIYSYVMMTLMNTFSIFTLNRKQSSLSLKSLPAIFIHPFFYDVIMLKFHQIIIKMFIGIFLKKHTSVDELN